MSQAPSMPVFTDALIGDTLHLSAEEFGAYCLLLFATWRNNGDALPDNASELAQICRVTPRRWRTHMRPKLVRFFNISDGRWHQKRLEKEWSAVLAKIEVNRSNGAKGGRPITQRTVLGKPNGKPRPEPNRKPIESTHTHTHSHSHSHKKLASNLPSDSLPRGWAEQAAEVRAAEGLPSADLAAEWLKFRGKIGEEPTIERWLGWARKAHTARPRNGSTDPSAMPGPPWPQRCRAWSRGLGWHPDWGPEPSDPGCWAPAELVADAVRRRDAAVPAK